MPTGKITYTQPVNFRQLQTICQFIGGLPTLSTEINLSHRSPKEVAIHTLCASEP